MRSKKFVRAYLRIAVLLLAACLIAHTRPAVAELENWTKALPDNDGGGARLLGGTFATKPLGHFFYRGGKSERIPFGGLGLIVSARKILGNTDHRGGWGPQLTGFLNKKKLFTLTFPDEIARNDREVRAQVLIVRLDPSTKFPQVVFSTHSNGPHCCTYTKIVTVGQSGRWQVIDGEKQDAVGYNLRDLDGDGSWELVSDDYSFLYAFGSYSESLAPVRISQLRSGKLEHVTTSPAFQDVVRKDLKYLESVAEKEPQRWHSNGFLAAWVAAKVNLSEGEAAWAKMLTNFDRSEEWGLTECTVERSEGRCPDGKRIKHTFPAALKRHLIEQGYKMNFDSLKME